MLSIQHVAVSMIVLLLHVWMLDFFRPSITEKVKAGIFKMILLEMFLENSEKLDKDP